MKILNRKTTKQTCGSRLSVWKQNISNTKNENFFNSLATVIRKNKRNAACNSEAVVRS